MTDDLDDLANVADRAAVELVGESAATDDATDRAAHVSAIDDIRKVVDDSVRTALDATATDEVRAAAAQTAREALSQLRGLGRLTEIANLNRAAVALTGVATLITAFFSVFGLATGDFQRMFRDFFVQSFLFMLFAIIALLLGTFAFVIDAAKSPANFNAERAAITIGMFSVGIAFGFGAWGLSQGQSAGPTRPVITATVDSSGAAPVLVVTADGTAVPRWQHLTTIVWEKKGTTWAVLREDILGPTRDGNVSDTIRVSYDSTAADFAATASLDSGNTDLTIQPPEPCVDPGDVPTTTTTTTTSPTATDDFSGSANNGAAATKFHGGCVLLQVPVFPSSTTSP